MAYNTAGYNTFASNENGVLEAGTTTSTGSLDGTETGVGVEAGTTTALGALDTQETTLALESGTTTAVGEIVVFRLNGYNDSSYNASTYNTSGGEIALGFETGETTSTGSLSGTETTLAIDAGTVAATGSFDTVDVSLAFEDGRTQATGALNAIDQRIDFVFRTHTRDVDLSFRLQRDFEFTENTTMTEIEEIVDTITNETRKLEFTAKEDGSKKDISGATIEWSLADSDGVVLDDSDPEVTITIQDALNGRFDVDVDTIDAPAGVYRQRVELTDGKGRVTRSTGTYRLKPF